MESKPDSTYIFEDMPVGAALRQMAVPVVISQLILLIYNMADTFFLGRTGNPFMIAGAALILPIYNVCIAFANIAGTGGGTLIARLLGMGRETHARKVASFSFWFSIFSGLFFSLATFIFLDPLLKLLGASGDTADYARQYVSCIIVAGAVPTILSMTMANLLRNAGSARQAGFGASMGGVLNILLDPLFMFVLLPEGYETLGAGIATALSNMASCIYYLITAGRLKSAVIDFSPRNGLPDKKELLSFFAVGIPAALGPFLFDIDYMVIDRLAASYNDYALAAIGIVLKVERLPLNVGVGLCLGMVPLAAYNYSSGNHGRMQDVVRLTRKTGILVALISIVLYELLAPQIIRLFISDAQTIAYGTDFLRIRAAATVMMFSCFIYVHFFQAIGRGNISLMLTVLRWACVNIPMLFLLNRLFGLYGLVMAQFISDTLVALISYLVYRTKVPKAVLSDPVT